MANNFLHYFDKIIVQPSSSYHTKAIANSCLEASYHQVIRAVKQLMQYYERDLKPDNESGFMAMHSFMCAKFFCTAPPNRTGPKHYATPMLSKLSPDVAIL